MRYSTNKDVDKIARLVAKTPGWEVHKRKRTGHLLFIAPNGERCGCSGTPSDWRVPQNLRKQLRHIGYEFPSEGQ